MKLYTEEQVKSAFRAGLREVYINEIDAENFANKGLKYLTPIELPSDEIVEQEADISSSLEDYSKGFAMGAYWILKKIKQQDK